MGCADKESILRHPLLSHFGAIFRHYVQFLFRNYFSVCFLLEDQI